MGKPSFKTSRRPFRIHQDRIQEPAFQEDDLWRSYGMGLVGKTKEDLLEDLVLNRRQAVATCAALRGTRPKLDLYEIDHSDTLKAERWAD